MAPRSSEQSDPRTLDLALFDGTCSSSNRPLSKKDSEGDIVPIENSEKGEEEEEDSKKTIFLATCDTCNITLPIWQHDLTTLQLPLKGIRSPNDRVWAPSIDQLYVVPTLPIPFDKKQHATVPSHPTMRDVKMHGLNFRHLPAVSATVWSRSMIDTLPGGEEAHQDDDDSREKPTIKAPYSLLKPCEEDLGENKATAEPRSFSSVKSEDVPSLEEVIDRTLLPFRLHARHTRWSSFFNNTDTVIHSVPANLDVEASDDAEPYMVQGYASFYNETTATLEIDSRFAEGNHSEVFYGTLTLPSVIKNSHRVPSGRVSVVVKVADSNTEAHRMLDHEAHAFRVLGESHPHLQHEWTGLNAMPGRMMPTLLHAVMPKFYGQYRCDKFKYRFGYTTPAFETGPCSLLLLEDCGHPIDPRNVSRRTRHDVLAMFSHLHKAGYIHGSPGARNILIKPGPLSNPPGRRSMHCPSLRLIDFGRTSSTSKTCGRQIKEEYETVMKNMRLRG